MNITTSRCLGKVKTDGTLAHRVYRKATNMDLYLHVVSQQHHPAQTRAVPPLSSTLHEISVIKIVYRMKFSTWSKRSKIMAMLDIHYAVCNRNKPLTTTEKSMGVALLPYQHLTPNKISRLLAKHNIKTIYIPKK